MIKSRLLIIVLLIPMLMLVSSRIPAASASGDPAILLQKTWGGSGDDFGQGIAVDSRGHIYLTGSTHSFGPGSPSHSALVLLKYGTLGTLLWQRIWNGTGTGTDEGLGVAVDTSGSVYVTGDTNSFGAGGFDVLLLKFDASGNLLWQRTWGGASDESGYGVTVDSSGNIYVTGYTASFGTSSEVFLLKFNGSGSLLWQKTWGGSRADGGLSVSLDASGKVYVTGYTYSFADLTYGDVILLKFDSSGNLLWQKTWGGSSADTGYGVAVDTSGSVYVTGYTYSFGAGLRDVFLLKFDASGSLLWQKTWGGSGTDWAFGIAVNSSNNIYVTGYTNSFGAGGFDVLLLKFDASGNLLWQRTWGGTSGDLGYGVAVDAAGNALLSGSVAEAPPYLLGSTGNSTLGKPTFTPGVPSFSLGTPAFNTKTPAGTVETPTGSESYAGGADLFLLRIGEAATITFRTNPDTGGSISFNGTTYTDSQSSVYASGNATALAAPPDGTPFTGWSTSGGVSVADPASNPTTVTIIGSGVLTANFTQSTPLTPLSILLTVLPVAMILVQYRLRLRGATSRHSHPTHSTQIQHHYHRVTA